MPTAPPDTAEPHDDAADAGDTGLAVRGLVAGYDAGDPVLHEISARLTPGRLTALLGPNAAGKSTLLKAMLGQVAPSAGSVTLDGVPVGELAGPALARRVSYVPQRGEASFAFTVREVVAMGRYAHGDRIYIDAALERCGLSGLADRPVSALSGGQRQRVLIARAWAQSRSGKGRAAAAGQPGSEGAFSGGVLPGAGGGVVLADEPAAGLDLNHAYSMMGLLKAMAGEGLAVLVVLHGLELAGRWADEVWLMDAGRLVARGPAGQVLRRGVLEPVYGVRLAELDHAGQRVFTVEGVTGGAGLPSEPGA